MAGHDTIVFIGPGVMAEAMAAGLIDRAGWPADHIVMAGPREERLRDVASRLGVRTNTDNRAAAAAGQIVVLSVKPQMLPEVASGLTGALPASSLVVSIVAGARLADLRRRLDHPALVRVMPNTPAQVGRGISVWTSTPDVTLAQRESARSLLQACGSEVFVDNEDYLDMATALSGTGPAYVFLFMEALVDAGVHLGFPRRIAEQLVVETVKGSVAYYESSPRHFARLRNLVTSPGGTSAAALYYLEKAGFRTALSRAIWAAYERSVELGRGKKRGAPEAE